RRAVRRLALPFADRRRAKPAGRARGGGADRRRRRDHGAAAPRVAGARRAVSSRVDPDRRGEDDTGEFPAMFQELIEKLTRHEDLTADEAAAAMAEVMQGRAAAGVRVAKHGNRSASSKAGGADVYEALGIRITAPPAVVERSLAEAGIGFFFAPTFHPSMRHAAAVRRELGVRTAFNLLGPLTNPAGATRQLVGVPRPEFTELMARSLVLLGTRRAWVVHGADGIDELTTTGYTKVSECRDGAVNTFYLHPADVGLPKAPPGALQGGDAHDNARIIEGILAGQRGPARDVVLLNAGAALFIAGAAASVDEGILIASRAIDRGDARRTLERLVSISTAEEFQAGATA